LGTILDRTNDWLKFAEAKNGAILVLNCAVLFGALQSLNKESPPSFLLELFLINLIFFLVAGIIFSAASLIPRLTPPWWIKFPEKKAVPNIFYFGDISSLTENSYLAEYYRTTGIEKEQSELDSQYANQIVTNSKIAYIKYRQFTASIWLTICAFMTPVGALFFYMVKA
jgi:hypothetical protein